MTAATSDTLARGKKNKEILSLSAPVAGELKFMHVDAAPAQQNNSADCVELSI